MFSGCWKVWGFGRSEVRKFVFRWRGEVSCVCVDLCLYIYVERGKGRIVDTILQKWVF